LQLVEGSCFRREVPGEKGTGWVQSWRKGCGCRVEGSEWNERVRVFEWVNVVNVFVPGSKSQCAWKVGEAGESSGATGGVWLDGWIVGFVCAGE